MTAQERRPAPASKITPVLATERLRLRAPRLADAQAVASLVNDRRVAENTARIPHPYGLADAEDFIRTSSTAETAFAVTLAGGALIGMCGLHRSRDGEAEIGYWLGVPYWGRGYATEAARALIDHAFDDPRHDLLVAGARVSNPASRRVLEKCGFQWTGVHLCRVRALNSSVPADRFRLDRGLWASLKSRGKAKPVASEPKLEIAMQG